MRAFYETPMRCARTVFYVLAPTIRRRFKGYWSGCDIDWWRKLDWIDEDGGHEGARASGERQADIE